MSKLTSNPDKSIVFTEGNGALHFVACCYNFQNTARQEINKCD